MKPYKSIYKEQIYSQTIHQIEADVRDRMKYMEKGDEEYYEKFLNIISHIKRLKTNHFKIFEYLKQLRFHSNDSDLMAIADKINDDLKVYTR